MPINLHIVDFHSSPLLLKCTYLDLHFFTGLDMYTFINCVFLHLSVMLWISMNRTGVMPELDQLQVDWAIYDVTYDIWHYNIRRQSSLISAWFLVPRNYSS